MSDPIQEVVRKIMATVPPSSPRAPQEEEIDLAKYTRALEIQNLGVGGGVGLAIGAALGLVFPAALLFVVALIGAAAAAWMHLYYAPEVGKG